MTSGKNRHVNHLIVTSWLSLVVLLCAAASSVEARTYPAKTWRTKTPEEAGLDQHKIDAIAGLLEGRGCIVRNGYIVKTWGDQSQKGGWMSSSKPVISTLLFFAIQEGRLDSVHTPIKRFGWDMSAKDQTMTFHHLANMISGYARPDKPGAAWAYNDYAINLYRLTLFDRLFEAAPDKVANDPKRLGALQFEDGLSFSSKAHVVASTRDFARLCWFWLNKGKWRRKQLLSGEYFDKYCKPHVPKSLPHTKKGGTDDYLGIGSYGGGSDHFTKAGPGIYGYNFWFNGTGREHPDKLTWPDAPADAFMTVGAGGNSAAIIPSLDMVVVAAKARWGNPQPGDTKSVMNRVMKLAVEAAGGTYKLSGELKKWHPIAIDFEGPDTSEMSTDPNPFLDYRLQVAFKSPGGKVCNVPGFYAGDGNGGGSGNIWRVRFSPDEAGKWSFRASFRKGSDVAVSLDPGAGKPEAFDGCTGTFDVGSRDENAPGFLKLGRLEYVGGYYLKFRDGPYWIKGGADSPEDFLSYEGFDNTRSGSEFRVKTYGDHVRHWRPGDPDWGGGKGKGIIGAVNYLAKENVNLIYFLPMNIGGDGKNVWPFAGKINPNGHPSNDNLHYDISKLRQWEIVFSHAQEKGIVLHCVFNEAERNNKKELGLTLTTERKLFYREMIARFGHHNAILWNLCEEYNLNINLGPENVRAFARYIHETDPYDHPVTVHHSSDPFVMLKPFIGDELFSITSIQIGRRDIEPVVERFRRLTREAGRPIPIAVDEFTVTTHDKPWLPEDDIKALRVEKLWPAYLSGGQLEFIVGDLLKTENFAKYEDLWRYIWYARKFLEENVPFWEMEPADDLLEGESVYKGKTSTHDGQVFAKPGQCYALYFPSARKTGTLDLTDSRGRFQKRWYNPRSGQFVGSGASVKGGGKITIGPPPENAEKDWALLLKRM